MVVPQCRSADCWIKGVAMRADYAAFWESVPSMVAVLLKQIGSLNVRHTKYSVLV